MSKRYNLARMSTATTGAGTITLGSAVTSYLSFADAGVSDGETLTYAIEDGNNREIGRGIYTASGTTLTRTVLKSTNSDAAINLSGTAEVFITFAAEDISTLSLADGSASTPSLTNEGDANTGLWFPAADSIALGTGGSEAVRIDSSQNVGIGITSPTVALDVAGAIQSTGNVTVGGDLTVTGDYVGLTIGTDVQAWDAQLDDIAALTPTDGNIIVGNGTTWVAESGATARTSLGLAIGTDVQAFDSQLTDVAGLTPADGAFIVGNGTNFVAETGATAIASLSSNLNAIETALDFEATDPIITWATSDSLSFDTSENHLEVTIGGSVVGRFSAQGLEVGGIYQVAANAALSGLAVDVALPDWCREVVIVMTNVSTAGDVGDPLLQLGDAGGIEGSGYTSRVSSSVDDVNEAQTDAHPFTKDSYAAADSLNIVARMVRFTDEVWITESHTYSSAGPNFHAISAKTLSQPLNQIRFINAGGATAFDSGAYTIYVR